MYTADREEIEARDAYGEFRNHNDREDGEIRGLMNNILLTETICEVCNFNTATARLDGADACEDCIGENTFGDEDEED